jgi:hypothetical protein
MPVVDAVWKQEQIGASFWVERAEAEVSEPG